MGHVTHMTLTTMSPTGNSPVYDEAGYRMVLAPTWRRPARPFRRPECCGRVERIGFGLFRCTTCAMRIKPERLHHRLMLWWNPIAVKGDRPLRRLVRVVRWVRVRGSTHKFGPM